MPLMSPRALIGGVQQRPDGVLDEVHYRACRREHAADPKLRASGSRRQKQDHNRSENDCEAVWSA
jgi:hypothetical protein